MRAIEDLLENPLDNPDTYAWAVRAMLDGSWGHLEDYFPAQSIVPEILDRMEEWLAISTSDKATAAEKAAAKSLLSRMRTLLGANHGAAFGAAVESMTREAAMRLRHKIELNEALPSPLRAQADRTIRLTRRDLEETSPASPPRKPTSAPRRLTPQGHRLREIATVKSRKLQGHRRGAHGGRPAGKCGYHYAKEEQKMPSNPTLTDLLSRARIFHAGDIDTPRIGFGTRIRLRNANTAPEKPTRSWAAGADAEHQILSKQAPMAAQLLGHGVGEQITIKHPGGGATPYEILTIENALE